MTKLVDVFVSRMPLEWEEQVKLAQYLDFKGLVWYHIPNGGTRNNKRECAKLTRMGVKAGCPDIVICHAMNGYHGMYIELKRLKGGNVKDNQMWWIERLNQQGYLSIICRGADKAIEKVEEYFKV